MEVVNILSPMPMHDPDVWEFTRVRHIYRTSLTTCKKLQNRRSRNRTAQRRHRALKRQQTTVAEQDPAATRSTRAAPRGTSRLAMFMRLLDRAAKMRCSDE